MRNVTRYAFLAVGTGLVLLGAIVRNDWSDASVVLSLAAIGLGEGALATLLFKTLASVAPTEMSEDVEPFCSATSHFAAAVGAAIAGALVIGVLSLNVNRHLARDPAHRHRAARASGSESRRLHQQRSAAAGTGAARRSRRSTSPNAVQINTDARLFALKLSFFGLAGLTFVGFLPVARSR